MSESTSVIDIMHLSKQFNGKPAVIDFNLQVKRGEICGFLGPNGSGKTTTLRMLCGLLTPDKGEGHCLGFDILKQSHEIKKHVGYMTQSFSLYLEMTARENLDFIARIYNIANRKRRIDNYLEMFDLTAHRHKLAGSLSGGMRQRLALAGCLLHEPQLLLLDEPTAGVDPKIRREFWDEIYLLSQRGMTTLVSTHYMDEAERCTRLVYIAYGHLLAQGTATELIQTSGLHTFEASGGDLYHLADLLKQIPTVEHAVFFGNTLHVSSKDRQALEQAILPFRQQYQWRPITVSLEEVFIHLVGQGGTT